MALLDRPGCLTHCHQVPASGLESLLLHPKSTRNPARSTRPQHAFIQPRAQELRTPRVLLFLSSSHKSKHALLHSPKALRELAKETLNTRKKNILLEPTNSDTLQQLLSLMNAAKIYKTHFSKKEKLHIQKLFSFVAARLLCVCEMQSKLLVHTKHKLNWRSFYYLQASAKEMQCFVFFFPFWNAQAKIESKASNLFLSPHQGFCCYTKFHSSLLKPWLVEGEITALYMLSVAVSSLQRCGWFLHPQNGSIIQSQTAICTTLTPLTWPDTWHGDYIIWKQPAQL